MSDIATHLFVPLLILIVIFGTSKYKYIFALLPLSILPDLDLFYAHRALLHNLFIPLALLIAYKYASEKTKYVFLFGGLFLFSHTLLDVFNGGVSILYPIYPNTFVIKAELLVNNNFDIYPFIDIGFKDIPIHCAKWTELPVFSSSGFCIVLLTGLIVILKKHIALKNS